MNTSTPKLPQAKPPLPPIYRKLRKKSKMPCQNPEEENNPHNLTEAQYEKNLGYRLLLKSEIYYRRQSQHIESWRSYEKFTSHWQGADLGQTYRTKLSIAEVAKLP